MPTIISSDDRQRYQEGEGWRIVTIADAEAIGAPVMVARHWFFEPEALGPLNTHGDSEQLLFVIKGSGQALVGAERLPLEAESMLWLEPGDDYQFQAGLDGLEILQGYTSGAIK
ncbi:MAG: hypothetical protein OEY93_04870 [Anaerolineae bacterium]|nr:hypothetical protein [Anaerolineae bacterium]